MKGIIFSILLFSLFFNLQAASLPAEEFTIAYDSTRNFLGNEPQLYIGQEFYVKGLPQQNRQFGYTGFVIDYKKDDLVLNDKPNVYQCGEGYSSRYDALAGHYFTVLDVIPHPMAKSDTKQYGDYYYIKLKENVNGNVLYYRYNSQSSFTFPFIVIGFYDKQRLEMRGNDYVFSPDAFSGAKDLRTDKAITNKLGQTWKCFGLAIDDVNAQLMLDVQDNTMQRTLVPYDMVESGAGARKAYTAEEATNYKRKFGLRNFNEILQNTVKSGMTKEMCALAWGEPLEKKELKAGREEWTYAAGTIVFSGDKVVKVQ